VEIGAATLVPLVDAAGELGELAELYPDVAPDAWRPYQDLYPGLFAGGRWRLPFGGYLIRSGAATVVVDTGAGPPGLHGFRVDFDGRLPAELRSHGVSPADVDAVVLTHLHSDHVGWNTDAAGAAFFPRARYLAHADALADARRLADRPHVRRCVAPLGPRLEPLDDGEEVAPGVQAVSAPGHHPGHLAIRIRSAGQEALILGDAAAHPALLDAPGWRFVNDRDHEQSVRTREQLVAQLAGTGTLAICGHFPEGGVGRVVTRDGRVVWERAA
jgi:glyoxylase-like metal-dependent hydrolase (beta-lactamase superfamily II)